MVYYELVKRFCLMTKADVSTAASMAEVLQIQQVQQGNGPEGFLSLCDLCHPDGTAMALVHTHTGCRFLCFTCVRQVF